MSGSDLSRYYSTTQVAEMFDVKVGTVRDWIRQGRLRAVKLSGERWRISQEELERFAKRSLEKKR